MSRYWEDEDFRAEEHDAEREEGFHARARLERLDDYVPACNIFYGADVIAKASSPGANATVSAGPVAEQRPPAAPGDDSSDAELGEAA